MFNRLAFCYIRVFLAVNIQLNIFRKITSTGTTGFQALIATRTQVRPAVSSVHFLRMTYEIILLLKSRVGQYYDSICNIPIIAFAIIVLHHIVVVILL